MEMYDVYRAETSWVASGIPGSDEPFLFSADCGHVHRREQDDRVQVSGPDLGRERRGRGWHAAIDLCLVNSSNAYDALACPFGVRNPFGFQPLAEDHGLPEDASDRLRAAFSPWGNP